MLTSKGSSLGSNPDPRIFIGGAWRNAELSFTRENPSRPDELIGRFGAATTTDIDDAYASAATAQTAWADRPASQRAAILREAARILGERAGPLAQTITVETGKPIRDSRGELTRGVEILEFFAGEAARPTGTVLDPSTPRQLLHTRRRALGVVAAITPWNFPVAIPLWKLAPAFVFGNAVCWKPSELAPRTSEELLEVLVDAGLPHGLLSMLPGTPSTFGDRLISHDLLGGLSFTGSNEVGESIAAAVAPLVPTQLELGGKNSIIVLADADLETAASTAVNAAMGAAGQRCTAPSRIIVAKSCQAELSRLLIDAVDGLVVGDPADHRTDVGPLASVSQRERAVRLLGIADDEGLEAARGAELRDPAQGYFMTPTLFLDVPHSSRLNEMETFAPILTVSSCEDLQDGLAMANDNRYGLSAAIFTKDLSAAFDFIRGVESGVVSVNRGTTGGEMHAPFGGLKASGSHARELGAAAREFFTVTQTVYLQS